MNLKIVGALAIAISSFFIGNANAASTHLGVIPLENLFDVSFHHNSGNLYTKTLREAGVLVSTTQNSNICFTLARTAVITDVQMQVFLSDPNSPSVNNEPAVTAWTGNNPPVMLMHGRATGSNQYDTDLLSQNFTSGVVVTGGSSLCMYGPPGKYDWQQSRVSGYYPVK